MRRRYDQRLSDNYMYTGKVSYVCSGSGTLVVITGFPVTNATVSWVTYPFVQDEDMSSSSSEPDSYSSSSSSSLSSLSESYSLESNSSESELITALPRLYVSSTTSTGFIVTYENIPPQVGYIEFSYNAV